MDRRARGILTLGFDVHHPALGRVFGLLHRDRFRTGIDDARESFAVTMELEQHARAILLRRSPIAAPGALQWVTELRQRRRGHQQDSQRARQATNRDSHRVLLGGLLYTDWN